jgi:hypothetical protein
MKANSKNSSSPAMFQDFSLVSGGLVYDIMRRIKVFGDDKRGYWNRAVFFALLTWMPLFILALFDGTLGGDKIEINFLEDFTIHIRFLFVVPFLILIEQMINRYFVEYVKTTERMVGDDQLDRFKRLIDNIDRMSNSYIPELLILLLVFLVIALKWNDLTIFGSTREFLARPDGNKLSPAGWYYLLFSFPFYQLLVFRWVWRWIIWFYSLLRFSGFRLHIEALHADNMGGLEYLNLVPLAFSFLFLAPTAGLAAGIGMEIAHEGATLNQYFIDILLYCIAVPLILYAPLLVFMPKVLGVLSKGIQFFGNLVTRHNIEYIKKWINNPSPKDEPILGSMDNSSLNDINGSYTFVQGTKILPVNHRMILSSFILTLLPFIPLIFTLYSGYDFLNKLLQTLFGS